MITEPKVTLLALTEITSALTKILPLTDDDRDDGSYAADYLAEFAGRSCYQSWDRPNPKTANTPDYVTHILDVQHYSVLAHASFSFYIEGVSRSLSLELIRSRFLAFSQVSQRYVDSSDLDWVVPPLFLQPTMPASMLDTLDHNFTKCVEDYVKLAEQLEEHLRMQGMKGTIARKRAREAARAVLPNDTETKLVVSGNPRAWRDFLSQRWSAHADLEIQRLAGVLLDELRLLAPATFADFGQDPAS